MTELHIGHFFEELHHHFQILQNLRLPSTNGASTAHRIEFIMDGFGRVEQGVIEGGTAGSGGVEVARYITPGV